MKKGAVSVRFSEEQNAILKKIATACDVSEVTIARWAVEALGDYFEHHGKRLLLPLKFTETFSVVVMTAPKPLILHEPPRVRSEVVRAADEGKIRMPAHKATARE